MFKRKREDSSSYLDLEYSNSNNRSQSLNNVNINRKSINGQFTDDFLVLSKYFPFLKKHMILNLRWKPFMPKSSSYHYDFNHPDSVYHLSKAILKHNYGLELYLPCSCEEDSCNLNKDLDVLNKYFKDLSASSNFIRYLAPCVPNRLSYIRAISSLLCLKNNESHISDIEAHNINSDEQLKLNIIVLDIGTGASCIYPLIGTSENSWNFIGTDIDNLTLELARENVEINHLEDRINLRLQRTPTLIFNSILYSHELVAMTMCNPPFHSSLEMTNLNPRTFSTGTERELVFSIPEDTNLSTEQSYMDNIECIGNSTVTGQLKFMLTEKHGDLAFIEIMLQESKLYCHNIVWFTTLVPRMSTLKKIKNIIHREMRHYNLNHVQQVQFLDSKLHHLYYEDSKFKFAPRPEVKIDVGSLHICEFRKFTLALGKQTRWVIAWTFYNSQQRLQIINNLIKLST
uniref:U6 small nuclear RNA (adenine-(43)-N(6))-methyltransferase n=1 Tax=Theileria annulata TaxID=5874 RepID=A0A3B0N6M7_THEAN